MAAKSSNRIKFVPEKLQYLKITFLSKMKCISVLRKLTLVLFLEILEKIMDSKRNASFSEASSDGASLCAYLSMPDILLLLQFLLNYTDTILTKLF